MVYDLAQFMCIWVLVQMMFSSVAVLIFGNLITFNTFHNSIIYFYQASIGTYTTDVFLGLDHNGDESTELYDFGVIYLVIFILINVVLLFNFVIAILSSTFAFYDKMKLGLYYNVLNSMFAEYEWDDHYGALICVKPPLPTYVLLMPLLPFYALLSGNVLKVFNSIVCQLLFLPHAIVVLILFTLVNILSVPYVYIVTLYNLVKRIFINRGIMESIKAICNLLLYIPTAPILFICTLPIDSLVFFFNLYVSDLYFEEQGTRSKKMISIDTLLEFNRFLKKLKVEIKGNKLLDEKNVPVVFVNKLAQKSLRVIEDIRDMIYSVNSSVPLFITDERGRVKLNMNRLQRLKEFNIIKRIFFKNCN